MEHKNSIIGGVCLANPLIDPERVKSLSSIEEIISIMPLLLFDIDKYYTVGQGDDYEPYQRTHGTLENVKWGQMKLLMVEVDFLCRYWDPLLVPSPQVVYIGAAPGTHIGILADLFPMITFHLYDLGQKYDFILQKKTNVTLNKEFLPEKWANRNDVYLISDIRNLTYKRHENITKAEEMQNEKAVWADMTLQQDWVLKVKPVKAHLKFRLPYSYDFVKKEGPTRPYLDGIVYRQPWAPATSTECRLVPYDNYPMRDWDYQHQESIMFFHNMRIRSKYRFYNPVTRSNDPFPPETGLGNDFDSTLTIIIVMAYMTKFRINITKESVVKMFNIFNKGALNGRTNLEKKRFNIKQGIVDEEGEDADDEDVPRKK